MKKVLFIAMSIVAVCFTTATVQASDIMSLSYKGEVNVNAYMTKDGVNMAVHFDYMFDNNEQRQHFQKIFNDVYVALENDGWVRSGFWNHDELTYTISCTYEEDGNILGIFLDRTWQNGGGYSMLVQYSEDNAKKVITTLHGLEKKRNPTVAKWVNPDLK
ncbi:MAG: hypothetical protein U9Q12_02440 [Patescibacteria group bacterium]|nr:hypothetical protein [Patescibacteria group bacterium]